MFTHKSLNEFDIKETIYKGRAMEIKILIGKESKQNYIVKIMPLIAFPSNYFLQFFNEIGFFFKLPPNKAILPVTVFFHDENNLYIGHNFDDLILIQEKEIEKFSPTQKTELIYTIAFALSRTFPSNICFSGLKLTHNIFMNKEGKMSIGFPIPVFHMDLEENDKYLPFFNRYPLTSANFAFGVIIAQLLRNEVDSTKLFEEFWTLDPLKFDEENDLTSLVRQSMDFIKENRPSFEQIANDMKNLHYIFPGSNKDTIVNLIKDLDERTTGIDTNIPNKTEFAEYLQEECEKSNDSLLYHLLGTVYSLGSGVPKSYDKALEYFSKSSFSAAKNNIAKIYSLMRQPEKSLQFLKESADEGYPVAMVSYFKTIIQKEFRPHPADVYIEKAAEMCYPLGHLELSNKLRFTDPKKSYYYLRIAATHGIAKAIHLVGIYNAHDYGVDIPDDEKKYYWVGAYAMKYPPSMNNYAMKIEKTDPEESVRLFRQAAEQQGAAAYNLANHLLSGEGCEKNPKEAFYWMKHAADLNNVNAMFDYALMLKEGVGCEKNVEQAEQECKKAASARRNLEAKKAFLINYSKEHGVELCESII